jgi:hypothetical protein
MSVNKGTEMSVHEKISYFKKIIIALEQPFVYNYTILYHWKNNVGFLNHAP